MTATGRMIYRSWISKLRTITAQICIPNLHIAFIRLLARVHIWIVDIACPTDQVFRIVKGCIISLLVLFVREPY
jgi:hypothetical protein